MIENSAIIILGASGDLAIKKLIPAIDEIYKKGDIGDSSIIVGSGRTEFTDIEFRDRFGLDENFNSVLFYHKGIEGLADYLRSKGDFESVIIFFSLPPSVYVSTAEMLSKENFDGDIRLVIEKPFGYNYESAKQMNSDLAKFFKEDQIFRIDHYLGKEAVQNILVFRFANAAFYPIWNSGYIESIQINAFEDIGIGDRAAYFDSSGTIRDMLQNHLIQLLALTTMEAPVSLSADDIRIQKNSILSNLRIDKFYRAQYDGYLDEAGVKKDSNTETYAEVKLYIDNFRWSGMPIYIRVGKALNRRGTEIGLRFKKLPPILFNKEQEIEPNKIIFKIQPAEGIVLDMASKEPGSDFKLKDTSMNFCYRDSFSDSKIPEAYQKLLFDALVGDKTLFVSASETERSWEIFDPILDKGKLGTYKKGTIPKSSINTDWIDFEKYKSICE